MSATQEHDIQIGFLRLQHLLERLNNNYNINNNKCTRHVRFADEKSTEVPALIMLED